MNEEFEEAMREAMHEAQQEVKEDETKQEEDEEVDQEVKEIVLQKANKLKHGSTANAQDEWDELRSRMSHSHLAKDDRTWNSVVELFLALDRNSDGCLDQVEISVAHNALTNFSSTAPTVGYDIRFCDFDNIDTDHSGTVDPEEWVAFQDAAYATVGARSWNAIVEDTLRFVRWQLCASTPPPNAEKHCNVVSPRGTCQSFALHSSWFSDREMSLQERDLIISKADQSGIWFCLSCDLEKTRDPTLMCCETLAQTLGHRTMRPVQCEIQVGDMVVVEDGPEKGLNAEVLSLFQRELSDEHWLNLRVEKSSGSSQGAKSFKMFQGEGFAEAQMETVSQARVGQVVNLKVPLRPGDKVKANVAKEDGSRVKLEAPPKCGTVLAVDGHKVTVDFGPRHRETIPLSWVVEMDKSSWLEVARSAAISTLRFLLLELQIIPENTDDRNEVENRLQRAFEPHGRFKYMRGCSTDDALEDSPSRLSNYSDLDSTNASDGPRLAPGDRGKILWFDVERLEAACRPDRKKHLVITVPIADLEPDPNKKTKCKSANVVLSFGVVSHFDNDSAIMHAAKSGDVKELRAALKELSECDAGLALQECDADQNTVLHAIAYQGKIDAYKVVYSRATMSLDQDAFGAWLNARNDWGRSALWVAIESGHLELCKFLLDAKSDVNLAAPVLFKHKSKDGASSHEFVAGPGMVCSGSQYKVVLFQPNTSCGTHFGWKEVDGEGGIYMVTLSFGEAAEACIMPGDELLLVNGKAPHEGLKSPMYQRLERLLSKRPLTLHFRKGEGILSSPLMRAARLGHPSILQLLLDYDADVTFRDLCGRSALDRAVRMANSARAEMDNKEQLDTWCSDGVSKERLDSFEKIIEILIDAGACEGFGKIMGVDGPVEMETPVHWNGPGCGQLGRFYFHVAEIDDPEVVGYLQRVVSNSAVGKMDTKTSDRKSGYDLAGFVVEKVQRIENVALMREYVQRLHMIKAACKNDYTFEPIGRTRVNVSWESLTGCSKETNPLDADCNEIWLLHGTSAEAVECITRHNFLLSLAGSNAGDAFGKGIYFAESAVKADEYTNEAPVGHPMEGLRPFILTRVALGRLGETQDRDTSVEVELVLKGDADSLLADREAAVGTFKEFIVFDDDQCYPEFIIWYKRRTGRSTMKK